MLTSPQVENYIELYNNDLLNPNKLNKESEKLVVDFFEIAKSIRSYGEEGIEIRKFYFFAPKGTFEEYKKLHSEDENTLKKWFKYEKDKWYEVKLICHHIIPINNPVYSVYINDFNILSVNNLTNKESATIDATNFIQELIDIEKEVITELKAGTYNERIRKEMPYTMRYGQISRHDYWEMFPKEKAKYAFSDHEYKIISKASKETVPVKLTARKFYEACAICYKAVGMEANSSRFEDTEEEHERYNGTTPKEMYYKFADGRDDGLCDVPLDDETEFQKWLNHEEPYTKTGGHPFEIVFSYSGNKSIHLYIINNKLLLTGGEYPANVTAARMYVGLVENNIPVAFDAFPITNRLEEKDYIGVLPSYVYRKDTGKYDNITLDENLYEKLKDKITWEEIPEVGLEETF